MVAVARTLLIAALVLVAFAGATSLAHTGSTAATAHSSGLRAATCSYPTETNGSAVSAPVSFNFAVTTGDMILAVEIATGNTFYVGHPFISAPTDGVNTYANLSYTLSAVTHDQYVGIGVFNATAATTATLAFTVTASAYYWTYLVAYDLPPASGAVLTVGTPSFEDGSGNLNLSASTGACGLLLAPYADIGYTGNGDVNGPLTAPAGWNEETRHANAGGFITASALDNTSALAGATTLRLTGGHTLGGGVLLAYSQSPPPSAPTALTATAASTTQLDLAWTNPGGSLTDSHAYEYTGSSCAGSPTAYDFMAVISSANFPGLSTGTTYSYTVTASNVGGESAPSACVANTTLPDVPTTLTNVTISASEIDLAWTNPSGSLTDNHVYIYAGAACGGSPTSVDLASVQTSYADTGLTPSTAYSYTITASTAGGEGAPTACGTNTTFNGPPSAPTGLTATPISTTEIDLAWTNPGGSLTDNHVRIFAGAACGGSATPVDLGSVQTSYSDTSLSPSTAYSYKVTASTSGGESSPSSCATATTFDPTPGAPTALTAQTISATEIDLAWTNPSGTLTDNHVYLYLGSLICGGGSPAVNDLGSVATTYPQTGLTASTDYSFTVTASTSGGEGTASACVGNTTFSAAHVPPAPSGVIATTEPLDSPHNYGEHLIDLTWTNPPGPLTDNTAYVYASSDCSSSLITSYDLGGVTTTAVIPGLTEGTSYCFTTTATNGTGESAQSTPTSASINTTLPAAPTAVIVTAASTSLFSVAWTDPAGNLTLNRTLEAFAPNDCGGSVIASTNGPLANPYLWGIVFAGHSACIEVAANTSGGSGPFSTPTSASINATLPNAPTSLTATNVSSSEIDLAWTNPGGNLTALVITEFNGASCAGTPNYIFHAGVLTVYDQTSLSANTTYSWTVNATTSGGTGVASSCASNTTLPAAAGGGGIAPSNTELLLVLVFVFAFVVLIVLVLWSYRRRR